MKKFLKYVVLAVVFTILFNMSASADSVTYSIPELTLDISLPQEYIVITRETPENDPAYSFFGVSKKDFMEYFEENHIYFGAISDNRTEELYVTMLPNEMENINYYEDELLELFVSDVVEEWEKNGVKVLNHDFYEHSHMNFVRIWTENQANSSYTLHYITVYDNKMVNFALASFNGKIAAVQESNMEEIIDTIKFHSKDTEIPLGAETKSFVHTDADSNANFTVPANWYETEYSESDELKDTEFVSSKKRNMKIIYGSKDLMPIAREDYGDDYPRYEVNNSFFSTSDLAIMFHIEEELFEKVTYGGREYYQATYKEPIEHGKKTCYLRHTIAVRVENGWIYCYQFNGDVNDEYFKDFRKLIDSVEYPPGEIPSTGLKSVFIISPILILIGLLFYKFVGKKIIEREEKKFASENNRKICPYCNAIVLDKEVFCHKCGKNLLNYK